jgi:hypothetical protein
MLNPKGNLSDEVQSVLDRCDDLSRHRWAECRRMLSDDQRSNGRRQQALPRRALVLSRSASGSWMRGRLSAQRPKQGRCHHRRPRPNISHRSTPSESFVAWARISPGEKRTISMAATQEESAGHPMPWRPTQKPAKSTSAPATTLSERQPAPLQYQAESEGHPMPWRPAEKSNGKGGAP